MTQKQEGKAVKFLFEVWTISFYTGYALLLMVLWPFIVISDYLEKRKKSSKEK